MKVVVDSNIVFSAMLNTKSRIGQLLTIGPKYYNFYTVNLLKEEISRHRNKIQQLSGLSDSEFDETFTLISSKIRFVDEILLSDNDLIQALKITQDIDEDDTSFVALTNHLKGRLWTGDKKLEKGLKQKSYSKTISTKDLYDDFLKRESKRKRKPK